jgi:hypothetical protein
MNKQETYKTIFESIAKAPDTWTGKLKVAAILVTEIVCAIQEAKAPEDCRREEFQKQTSDLIRDRIEAIINGIK